MNALEQAAEQYGESFKTGEFFERIRIEAFKAGAEWQKAQTAAQQPASLKVYAEWSAALIDALKNPKPDRAELIDAIAVTPPDFSQIKSLSESGLGHLLGGHVDVWTWHKYALQDLSYDALASLYDSIKNKTPIAL
jgi:hypothetical protein